MGAFPWAVELGALAAGLVIEVAVLALMVEVVRVVAVEFA